MKKILFILLLFSCGATASSTDSIPNGDFEVFLFSTWYAFPQYWATNNTQLLAPTIVPDTGTHSGQLAMRLTNYGALQPHAWTEFAVSGTHANVGCWANSFLAINDSATIEVKFYYNSQVVDSGFATIYNGIVPGYFPVIIPITQNSGVADTCRISILGGALSQSDVVIDDMQFDFFSNIGEIDNSSLNIYPNPSRDFIIFQLRKADSKVINIYAGNFIGQKVHMNSVMDSNGLVRVDVKSLSPGIWTIYVKDENETYSAKFIKEK